MTESRTSAPGRGEGLERDELLATKVTIPRIRPGSLARPRLLDSLDEAMDRELTLVCTPAGFGKTTLLADWAQAAKRPVAWLSLDPEDSDPIRFWRYVVAALDRSGVPADERVRSLLEDPGAASSEDLVTAVVNQLEALPDEVALVLDDYHAVESSSIHDGLAFLLEHQPAQLHLVVTSRSDPPLPLAQIRAHGQLAELRAADLRFTAHESTAFLREVWGLDLSPEAVAVLESRTEGWAVGLQLAALSLREHPDPEAFLGAFTGSHRYVLDYLTEEVLERQPDRMRRFLLETSILERLSGPLCDAVTGDSDGQAMLEELERANLFIVPLDEQRRWYRFHHLFGDLLRVWLRRVDGDRIRELHSRAAGWCERHGLVDEAIRHATSAEDPHRAARLVEEHLAEILRRGEGVILDRWLSALPEDLVRRRPVLCLAQGWMQLHIGHLDAAERLAEHAERAFERGEAPGELELPTAGGMVTEVPAAIALLRADLAAARGDIEGLADSARFALARMGRGEHGPRFLARFQLACVDWMGGRLEEAELALGGLLAEGRAAPDPYPLISSCFALGQVLAGRGKLGAALRTNREGLRFATKGGRVSAFHAGEAHIGIAQTLYQRNELDDALQHATAGIELCRNAVEFVLPAVGLVTLGWIRQAMGEADGALEAIDEACRIRPSLDFVALWNPAQPERARLLLAQGQVEEAGRWAEQQRLTEDDDVSYVRERDHLVLARVFLARHEPARARRLLDRLDVLAESQGRSQSLIEVRALRSLALQSAGDHQGALSSLGEALSMARPEGYVRVFADEGGPMAALIQSLIRLRQGGRPSPISRIAREHALRVVRAFRAPARLRGEVVSTETGLVEPLTRRELEVLRLIAAGKRNREIARDLVVTHDTAKKHVSHIFAKLGAASRTEAVAQARDLGLIP